MKRKALSVNKPNSLSYATATTFEITQLDVFFVFKLS